MRQIDIQLSGRRASVIASLWTLATSAQSAFQYFASSTPSAPPATGLMMIEITNHVQSFLLLQCVQGPWSAAHEEEKDGGRAEKVISSGYVQCYLHLIKSILK